MDFDLCQLVISTVTVLIASYVLVIGLIKVPHEIHKWHTVTLMTACVIANCFYIFLRIAATQNVTFAGSTSLWLTVISAYLGECLYVRIQLVVCVSLAGVYCIYNRSGIIPFLHEWKWTTFWLLQIVSQLLSAPAFLPAFFSREKIQILKLYMNLCDLILISTVSLTFIIWILLAIYRTRDRIERSVVGKRLRPILLYFVPIVLIDIFHTAMIVTAVIYRMKGWNKTDDQFRQTLTGISKISVPLRSLFASACTIIAFPSYRNATLKLLHCKTKTSVITVVAKNNDI